VLGVSSRFFISFLVKSHFRERVQCEPSVVDLLAVLVDCFPLARKLAVRGAREKVARLCADDLNLAVGGLPPGRCPEFLCGLEDRHR